MLARIALRMATIAALRGKTLVDDNVLDSEITALDADADGNLTTDQQKAFVTVYTNIGSDETGGDRSLHRSGRTELVIEIAVASTMVYRNEDGDKEVAAGIPATDAAFEFYLDVVGRQIVNALSDPADAWVEIWRGLSSKVVKVERKRTSDATGTRIAAHQLVVTVDLLPDPVFGEPLAETSIWSKFFARLDESTDPVVAAKATLLRSLIGEPGGTMADAQQRRFGMTLEEVRALLNVSAVDGSEPDISAVELEVGQ
jgi:hypothetical protein